MELVKIVIYAPANCASNIRKVLAESGAGHIGNYDCCSFSVKGTGRFRPLEGTNPHVGKQGEITQIHEERIETVCIKDQASDIIAEIKKVHPYEEPAIDVYPLLNLQVIPD